MGGWIIYMEHQNRATLLPVPPGTVPACISVDFEEDALVVITITFDDCDVP